MTEERQAPMSPMMATFQATLGNLLAEARQQASNQLLRQLAGMHMQDHTGDSGSSCKDCVMLGIAEPLKDDEDGVHPE